MGWPHRACTPLWQILLYFVHKIFRWVPLSNIIGWIKQSSVQNTVKVVYECPLKYKKKTYQILYSPVSWRSGFTMIVCMFSIWSHDRIEHIGLFKAKLLHHHFYLPEVQNAHGALAFYASLLRKFPLATSESPFGGEGGENPPGGGRCFMSLYF